MWLIDTETLKLCPVYDLQNTPYAILSHTWEGQEVSFQEFQNVDEKILQRPSFAKIRATCRIAQSRKTKYAWVDTCCIDKSSSAELSEAINSMFHWYQKSKVCFVQLADLAPLPPRLTETERRRLVAKKLRTCRWLSRGWTLQELIAPTKVEFFDSEWNFIGARSDLVQEISDMTNIDEAVLQGAQSLSTIPVGRKMSWAAGRQTTRAEDRAYSLLGIFGVSMPLLYGEGPKAFERLQQHLASENNDFSLFAWQYKKHKSPDNRHEVATQVSGIFAETPDDFHHCATLKMHLDQFTKEFTLTNAGLRISTKALCKVSAADNGEVLLDLDCVETSARTNGQPRWLGVRLAKIANTYFRVSPHNIETVPSRAGWTALHNMHGRRGGRSEPPWVVDDIYVKTFLPRSDSRRFSSLMANAGIVIAYHEHVLGQIKQCIGLPSSSCRLEHNTDDSKDEQGPQDSTSNAFVGSKAESFVFDVKGVDNFLGVNMIGFEDPSSSSAGRGSKEGVAIVCCLQWNSESSSHQLRYGLFSMTDILQSEKEGFAPAEIRATPQIRAGPPVRTRTFEPHPQVSLPATTPQSFDGANGERVLNLVKDLVFVRYSDLSGLILQQAMPTRVDVYLKGLRQLRLRYAVRELDGAALGPDFLWQDGYHHLLLE